MEISQVRNRLRLAIDRARGDAVARRVRTEQAGKAYTTFLTTVATPVFKQFANALVVEGFPFQVFTPAAEVKLASERSPGDFIELSLDTATDPPMVIVRVTRGRGSRVNTTELPLREGVSIGDLLDEDVLGMLLREIPPFVER